MMLVMAANVITWAHPTWNFIHSLPRCTGSNARDRIATAFCQLVHVIPCPKCRAHAIQWVAQHSPYAIKHIDMKQYFFEFHNSVNARLNKRLASTSVLRQYTLPPSYEFSNMHPSITMFWSKDKQNVRNIMLSIAELL